MSDTPNYHDTGNDFGFYCGAAVKLAVAAEAAGYIITIERKALEPLAMGNTTPVVSVRPKRIMEPEPLRRNAKVI